MNLILSRVSRRLSSVSTLFIIRLKKCSPFITSGETYTEQSTQIVRVPFVMGMSLLIFFAAETGVYLAVAEYWIYTLQCH
jgi:hypothetical protein